MSDLASMTFSSLLDAIGQRSPSPGGGAVAGAAGALSCAMARMVAAYSIKKSTPAAARKEYQGVLDRFAHTDRLLRALMEQDGQAYEAMTAAGAARKDGDEASAAAYREAVLRAIGVPLEMATLAADALHAMDQFKESANRYLLSDLGVAAVLAHAAAQAAAFSVRINLKELTDTALRTRIASDLDRTLAHCNEHHAAVQAYVGAVLE